MYVTATLAFYLSIYWILGGAFVLMDLTGKPEFLQRYKIHDIANKPLTSKQLIEVIRVTLFNQICIGVPAILIGYYLKSLRGFPENFHDVPDFSRVLYELAAIVLIDEICTYYSHRLLHSKFLYNRVHKKHHEWMSPIAVGASYCHPVEHIIGNIFPTATGTLIMQSHTSIQWIWLALVMTTTIVSHSGYHIPMLMSPESHDFHHIK